VLVIGNDATQQNPLVAWQTRTGIRHHNQSLYLISAQPSKLERKAALSVRVPAEGESAALRSLANGEGGASEELATQLGKVREALEKVVSVVIAFGAEISGPAIRDLVGFASRLPGSVRCMALGDYANSRGASDFGVLPDRLPGYAALSDEAERGRYGKLWGGEIPAATGLTARQMMEAAQSEKLKALYVVGANPVKTFGAKSGDRLGGLELLIVQDLFLTETAQRADVVFPAASTYEKDGTLTSTSGEVQMTHRAIDPQGPRSDFDLLRILSFQLSQLGMGPAIRLRTPEAAFEEIRQHVPGYGVSFANLLSGGAERSAASAKTIEDSYAAPAGTIFSSQDNLFSSGTLGRYCSKLESCHEAKEKPWSSSPSIQSWWYR
jgi:NADH-quinone oxidoreductase subunit G